MSIFPTKILLATDGSKDAELATKAAIELANATGSELHVVYVGEFGPLPRAPLESKLGQIAQRLTRRTRSVLGERIALIAAAGGGVSGEHARVGRPAQEIVALAQEIEAGLIVMGSRGRGGGRGGPVGRGLRFIFRPPPRPGPVGRGGGRG